MTRIDFYILDDDNEAGRINMVCRLAEKAVKQSKKVFIHTEDARLAETIDKALWDFRNDAFVPHRTVGRDDTPQDPADAGSSPPPEPVDIGFACQPHKQHTVLINLGAEVPPFFSRFERTLEIVNRQQDIRDSGRDRYRFYQQRGYPLHTHKM